VSAFQEEESRVSSFFATCIQIYSTSDDVLLAAQCGCIVVISLCIMPEAYFPLLPLPPSSYSANLRALSKLGYGPNHVATSLI
jgi:hypothetical protein